MAKQRYAGMDETGEYFVHGLGHDANDLFIYWDCGTLTITGQRDYSLRHECDSFAHAEEIIAAECNVAFDHEEVHWSPSPGLPAIRRPIERRSR